MCRCRWLNRLVVSDIDADLDSSLRLDFEVGLDLTRQLGRIGMSCLNNVAVTGLREAESVTEEQVSDEDRQPPSGLLDHHLFAVPTVDPSVLGHHARHDEVGDAVVELMTVIGNDLHEFLERGKHVAFLHQSVLVVTEVLEAVCCTLQDRVIPVLVDCLGVAVERKIERDVLVTMPLLRLVIVLLEQPGTWSADVVGHECVHVPLFLFTRERRDDEVVLGGEGRAESALALIFGTGESAAVEHEVRVDEQHRQSNRLVDRLDADADRISGHVATSVQSELPLDEEMLLVRMLAGRDADAQDWKVFLPDDLLSHDEEPLVGVILVSAAVVHIERLTIPNETTLFERLDGAGRDVQSLCDLLLRLEASGLWSLICCLPHACSLFVPS